MSKKRLTRRQFLATASAGTMAAVVAGTIPVYADAAKKADLSGKVGSLSEEYEQLKKLVAEIESDINKTMGGNKAAGERVILQMEIVKVAAKAVRKAVPETRKSER
jgi:hypothetical protein